LLVAEWVDPLWEHDRGGVIQKSNKIAISVHKISIVFSLLWSGIASQPLSIVIL
jgi:hypothetical protein